MDTEVLEEIKVSELSKDDEVEFGNDILFIIVLLKNPNFKELNPYDIKICGKKMWEWVALAGDGCEIKTISMTEEGNIFSLCKPFLNDKPFTAIFYSDTPLFKKETFVEIMEYFCRKGLNVLKLSRGFVFKTDYLKDCQEVMSPLNHYFDGEDFITCFDYKQLALIQDILKNRILDFHMANGVNIINPLSTFIEADVIIESGTIIEQNNIIKGLSFIDKNVKLGPNNVINNSIISSNCEITCSFLENCRISENKSVGPYEKIINESK